MKCTVHMRCTVHTCCKLVASRLRINSWLDLSVLCAEGLPAIFPGWGKVQVDHHTEMTFLVSAMQVVPILRAGLVLVEQISTVLPSQVTYHVGLVRNEETLQVMLILNTERLC